MVGLSRNMIHFSRLFEGMIQVTYDLDFPEEMEEDKA